MATTVYLNIQHYRGSQDWNKLNVSDYIPLPNTHKFTTSISLQSAAQRCRKAMIQLIGIHNERAVAHNREIQAQKQNEDEEEDPERAEWTRTIVAVKAKNARDAEESWQSRAGNRMSLWKRR
ncbi:hypothetical protein BOTNAR_0491g00030 [Botryotinia narcissicola]|uniref:Uncharacterized protein n=1 Tax=Botryotinia narcissicola TaxID=278944 RepID=A0A4Z1HT08_9HELO|nr:hypothetical protein BOTNAR_0491g00030 [Botryotinia narcissicola]